MIRSVCCVCHIQYGTKAHDEPGDLISHGLCQRHCDEAMANINSQFAELEAGRAREVAA